MSELFETEDEFIAWLRRRSRVKASGLRVGIGDDAGLIRPSPGRDIILTADLSIEDVHFSKKLHPPEAVGHRALARSLSDVAAMGGKPKFALITLGLSKHAGRPWIEGFYAGAFRLARRFGVTVLGGDTAFKPGGTFVDVIVVGDVGKGKALLRSGAQPGDAIFVGGTLGLAALGLRLLRLRPKGCSAGALRAHLYPEPQCGLGQFLVARSLASAAMDLSDGLSLDLARLVKASGVGARIWSGAIPTVKRAMVGTTRAVSPLALALEGGEDYKLLFTVPRSKLPRVPASFEGIRLIRIGEICAPRCGVVMLEENGKSRPLAARGYDHFQRN